MNEDNPDFPPVHQNECRLIDNECSGQQCVRRSTPQPAMCSGMEISNIRKSIIERVPVGLTQPCDAGLFRPVEYLPLPVMSFAPGTVLGYPSDPGVKRAISLLNVFATSAVSLSVIAPSSFSIDRGFLKGTLSSTEGSVVVVVTGINSRGNAVSEIHIEVTRSAIQAMQ